jgi:predicted ATP-dependent endonuclease of OLD family
MRYTFFEFENFKGIKKARLDLSAVDPATSRVFTLVGLNESGKTTVLEAIDLFQPIEEGGEVSPKQLAGWKPPDPQVLIPIAERTNFNGEILITCGIELDDQDVDELREHLARYTGFRLEDVRSREIEIRDVYAFQNSSYVNRKSVWKNLSFTGKLRTGSVLRTITSSDEKWQEAAAFLRKQLPVIWFFPNFLFEFPERIYLEESSRDKPRDVFYRALFQDILDALDRNLDITKHVVDRARSDKKADKRHLNQLLLEVGRNVTENVVSAWNDIFSNRDIQDKAVRIDWAFTEEEDEEDDRLFIEFQIEDADGYFSVSERSLGFRWFFVYLLLTTYRGRRRGASRDMLFLFDEPASNLHSTAQSALLKSFRELSKQTVVVYTTHSHHLINPEWLGKTAVVTNKGLEPGEVTADYNARRTDIEVTAYREFAAHHPNQTSYFQPILDVLEYAPSRLELVPSLVMVEGKSDYYLLKYFQKEVLKGGSASKINLLPGGGSGSLDRPIQLYLGWARPFVVLLDSDEAGERERERYLEKFGIVLKERIMTLREASSEKGVTALESLLAAGERLALQRVAEPNANRYTKKGFARGVQEALAAEREVAISNETKKKIENVLSAVGKKLASVEFGESAKE